MRQKTEGILAHRFVALSCCRKNKTNFKLNTMNTSTKQTENLAECGNKSKPLLAEVISREQYLNALELIDKYHRQNEKVAEKPILPKSIRNSEWLCVRWGFPALKPIDSTNFNLSTNDYCMILFLITQKLRKE
jgi:hypothetical protein